MDSPKLREMNCDEDDHVPPPIHSVTVDTLCNFSPLGGAHGIGKRKFMITDILNNTNKSASTPPGSPNQPRERLHSSAGFGSSAFRSLETSTNAMNTSSSSTTTTPTHFNYSSNHPAAAAAAMAAIGAAGTDFRLYSNFLPAAALQQIQHHREQLILNHQRTAVKDTEDDIDDTPGTNSNDVDVEEDNGGDSEGK